jgi:alpha-L-fucosidase
VSRTYEPSWSSLRSHATPQWLRDGKFGIYTHWGVYSVPACGPNGSWYPHNMYREGNPQFDYHARSYGPASEFGYKDFIPLFTAEKFDPEEWASLFKAAGARFAGPVAEHHDGFSMWDSQVNEWNAARMGPKRDVVGELEKAIRGQDMRFMVALHHFEQWWFYPHWRSDCDVANPEYAGLYGPMHNLDGLADPRPNERWREWLLQDRPPRSFHDFWRGKAHEVIETYRPDLIWFDFGIRFVQDAGFKEASTLIHNLIDNVSKNGYLLLNVGPKADGSIPPEAQDRLIAMGRWLEVNGEAIFETMPWMKYGEGPTEMKSSGMFSEQKEVEYTPQDIRFTCRDNLLYATCLGWPEQRLTIRSMRRLYPGEIDSVRMLGVEGELKWSVTPDGLEIEPPEERPCEDAFVFKITRKDPF